MAQNKGKPVKFIRSRGRIIPIYAKDGAGSARDLGRGETETMARHLKGDQKKAFVKGAAKEYSKESKQHGKDYRLQKNLAIGAAATSAFGFAGTVNAKRALKGATSGAGRKAVKQSVRIAGSMGKYGALAAGLFAVGAALSSRASKNSKSNAKYIKKVGGSSV